MQSKMVVARGWVEGEEECSVAIEVQYWKMKEF